MKSIHLDNLQQNQSFEENRNQERQRIEAEDKALREAAEREMRGLPSREVEERNRQIRERQAAYWAEREREQQQAHSAQPQPTPAVQQPTTDDTAQAAQVKATVMLWQAESPLGRAYFPCMENFSVMVQAMVDSGFDPTQITSWDRVYQMVQSKLVRPAASAPPASPIAHPATSEYPVNPATGVPFTVREIEEMPADEYARIMRLRMGQQVKLDKNGYVDFSAIKTFGELQR